MRWLCEPKRWYGTNASTQLGAADFRGLDFIAERRGIAQVRFDFVARKLAKHGRTIPSSSRNLAPLAFRDGATDIAECRLLLREPT